MSAVQRVEHDFEPPVRVVELGLQRRGTRLELDLALFERPRRALEALERVGQQVLRRAGGVVLIRHTGRAGRDPTAVAERRRTAILRAGVGLATVGEQDVRTQHVQPAPSGR